MCKHWGFLSILPAYAGVIQPTVTAAAIAPNSSRVCGGDPITTM